MDDKNKLGDNSNVKFIVGDIRDFSRVAESLLNNQPSLIIIAAALKQVDTCEVSPFESVQTNILGIKNIIDVCCKHKNNLKSLETVLMVSTDKAWLRNVYECKSIAERLVTSSSISTKTKVIYKIWECT